MAATVLAGKILACSFGWWRLQMDYASSRVRATTTAARGMYRNILGHW